MIILLQNVLFLKEFLACNGCFGLFTIFKKGSGASFCCTFPAWLFHKNLSYLILYQWTRCQSHAFFPFQDIKQNELLNSYLDIWDLIIFLDLSSINFWSNGWQEEKERNRKIQKSEYLEKEKSFLNEIKNLFHSF